MNSQEDYAERLKYVPKENATYGDWSDKGGWSKNDTNEAQWVPKELNLACGHLGGTSETQKIEEKNKFYTQGGCGQNLRLSAKGFCLCIHMKNEKKQ